MAKLSRKSGWPLRSSYYRFTSGYFLMPWLWVSVSHDCQQDSPSTNIFQLLFASLTESFLSLQKSYNTEGKYHASNTTVLKWRPPVIVPWWHPFALLSSVILSLSWDPDWGEDVLSSPHITAMTYRIQYVDWPCVMGYLACTLNMLTASFKNRVVSHHKGIRGVPVDQVAWPAGCVQYRYIPEEPVQVCH